MPSIKSAFETFPKSAEKSDNLSDIYACTGNRAYLVGNQNGLFPDIGDHVADEMGGLWAHPIKLLDGFWLQVGENGRNQWLTDATQFENHGIGTIHRYSLPDRDLTVEQRTVIPDDTTGLLVEYELSNEQATERDADLTFLVRSDLRPTWLAEEQGVTDAPDDAAFREDRFVAEDRANPWAMAVELDAPLTGTRVGRELWGPERTAGDGISGTFSTTLTLPPGDSESLTIAIAGSEDGRDDATDRVERLLADRGRLVTEKQTRYAAVDGRAAIDSPDSRFDDVYSWVKLNLDMLRRDVPGVGEGFGAGLPTYPWWFGTDGAYTVQGALPMGFHEEAKQTLRTLARLSERENSTGRIIHEASTNGVVFNPGNTQETPHFVRAVSDVYRWTGDQEFLEDLYPTCVEAMQYLYVKRDDDDDGRPEGFGIMEVKGLNLELIDSAVYGLDGLRALRSLAIAVGDDDTKAWVDSMVEAVTAAVEPFFWSEEENLYRDMAGTPRELLDRISDIRWQMDEGDNETGLAWCDQIEDAADTIVDSTPEQDQPWQFKQWVVATPLEVGLTPTDRASTAFETLETETFTGDYGMKLSGIGNDQMMTISTGVLAVAEAEYGRVETALDYLNRMVETEPLHMPGSISEMLPDYGCAIQAWTAYGFGNVLVEKIAGIRPQAGTKSLTLAPVLPDDWDELSVTDLPVGDTCVDYSVERTEGALLVELEIEADGWTLDFDLPESSPQPNTVTVGDRCYDEVDDVNAVELPSGVTTLRVSF